VERRWPQTATKHRAGRKHFNEDDDSNETPAPLTMPRPERSTGMSATASPSCLPSNVHVGVCEAWTDTRRTRHCDAATPTLHTAAAVLHLHCDRARLEVTRHFVSAAHRTATAAQHSAGGGGCATQTPHAVATSPCPPPQSRSSEHRAAHTDGGSGHNKRRRGSSTAEASGATRRAARTAVSTRRARHKPTQSTAPYPR
jgi:hypothetical protein